MGVSGYPGLGGLSRNHGPTHSPRITLLGVLNARPVASSKVTTASFPGADRIVDYAKEMSTPTFDLNPEKISETERLED